ncbi:MAG: hypothetical protein QXT77_09575 [Candidatus Methanomethylicaceae archaeon]
MGFIEVYVITPDGERYKAEIDENADVDTLLQDLVTSLGLPTSEKGKPISYTLKLVNALKLHRGVTVEIARVSPPSSVRKVVKE